MMKSAQDWATKNVPGAIDGARYLSLSEIKSEHIGGVARRELGDKECFRPVRRRAKPARPSRIDACVPHYNISHKTAVRDGGAALRTQQRGQGIPVGSNRSAVPRIHFATAGVAAWPYTWPHSSRRFRCRA